MVESEMISKVKALGNTKNNPKFAIITPKKMGFRETLNKPLVTNSDLFTSSTPIRHESPHVRLCNPNKD